MPPKNTDNKDLLQKWYTLDGHAQQPSYRLQSIPNHIPGLKDWNYEQIFLSNGSEI